MIVIADVHSLICGIQLSPLHGLKIHGEKVAFRGIAVNRIANQLRASHQSTLRLTRLGRHISDLVCLPRACILEGAPGIGMPIIAVIVDEFRVHKAIEIDRRLVCRHRHQTGICKAAVPGGDGNGGYALGNARHNAIFIHSGDALIRRCKGDLPAKSRIWQYFPGKCNGSASGNGVWLIVGLVASLAIMAFGVGNGIEKANKVMMPALFFLFVVLGIYICTLPGASEGYKYIFTLKPEGLLNPQVWVFAFGQAFFSLSVAGNGSVIYGSYLPKDEDLPSSARNVALFDTIAALLAAIVIIPAMAVILGDGIVGMKGGPGLMFVYLVNVFNAMPGGRIVGMIFYICVLFAGVSSIVNLYEAPVAFLQEKLHTNRVLSVVIIGAVGGVIALCIQPWTSQWMDVVSIYICPLGALLAGIMFFWVMKKDTALAAVHEGRTAGKKDIGGWFYPLGKWVYCAASLAALILGAIYGGIG